MSTVEQYSSPAAPMRPSPHLLPLTQLLSEAVVPVAIGLLAGFAVLLFLRAARLRWSWALLAAPLVWPVWAISWKAGLLFGLATAICGGTGAYWHLEDERSGGEAARAVRDAIGPLAFARAWRAERRVRGGRANRANQGRTRGGELCLGRSRRGGVCRVPFGLNQGVFGRSAREVFYASTVDGRAKRAWRAHNAAEREAAAVQEREPELLTLLTMHECRHTFASLLIETGANPKAIQEVMGHSKIQTTFDVYGHLLPGSYDDVRSRMDAYLASNQAS